MRILLITRYFPPLDAVATLRMYSWAKYLSEKGHDIHVLTTTKEGQVIHPLEADLSPFTVYEIPYFDPLLAFGFEKKRTLERTEGKKQRLFSPLLNALKRFYRERMNERLPGRTDPWILPAVKFLKRQKAAGIQYDAIISSYGPPSAHIAAYYAKKLFGCLWIADYRDLWLENHTYKGVWPFTWLEKVVEKKIIYNANIITTVSNGLAETLQLKFPSKEVHVITNGFEPDWIDRADEQGFYPKDGKLRIVHTGSIYKNVRDPTPLFQSIHLLPKEIQTQIEVLFYGHCSEDLQTIIDREHARPFAKICGPIKQIDAYKAQKAADLLLFLESPDPKIQGVMTGKLFEYLYVDTPILGVGITPETAPGKLILKTQAGDVCGNDTKKIVGVLHKTYQDRSKPQKNKLEILKYSRQAQADKLADLLYPIKL